MEKIKERILGILKEDSRVTHEAIAGMVGASVEQVHKEIESMEESGIIAKYTTIVNEDMVTHDKVEAMIEVKVRPMISKGFDAMAEFIMQFDEVKNVFLMSGGYDLSVQIEGKSLKQVALFVSEKLSGMDNVLSTATHFVLKKYKVEGVVMKGEQEERLLIHP